jgi:hypothetical protein
MLEKVTTRRTREARQMQRRKQTRLMQVFLQRKSRDTKQARLTAPTLTIRKITKAIEAKKTQVQRRIKVRVRLPVRRVQARRQRQARPLVRKRKKARKETVIRIDSDAKRHAVGLQSTCILHL